MKLELKPDIIEDGSNAIHQTGNHAGVTKDGLYSWVYKDSVLEVIHNATNESQAQWRFGKVVNDKNTVISCVTDFHYGDNHMLLVATKCLAEEGILCLFSISKKKVVRTIEFPQKIQAVEIVFTNTKEDVPTWIMSKHLSFFCGLAAVGTEGGYTYLLDLCLDDVMIYSTTEFQPKKLVISSPNLVDPKTKRNVACSSDRHLAVLIDEHCHRNGQFYYRRQDDSIDKVFEEDEVSVTSLKYLSQAGILTIGFNFGCFQLWRLYTPVLDYSTRFTPKTKAVSSFVVQEPENDPRNLVYLWIGRDNSVVGEDHGHGNISNINLYQLCFNKKDFYPGFGLFYEDLESVCGRLDHNLSANPYVGGYNQTTWSSQIVCAYTIVNPHYTPPVALSNDSFEESTHGNDLSLSMFVWRADSKQSTQSASYWMAIFDLNRWYHAQMPHSINCVGSATQVCPYWAVYKLDEIVALSFPQALLHVHVMGNNVLKFINKSPLPPEEHSFPSALEITDMRFITPQRTVIGQCRGWQGHLLQELMRNGALHLVQPVNFYHQCLQARLIPQNYNETIANSMEHQRIVLLNLSLDHNLTVRLIHNCIFVWGDGEFVDAGCSLTMLLEWAWSAVGKIKKKLDAACRVLYDCSGHALDPYTDGIIARQHCSLISLKEVFTIFLSQANPLTDKGQQELEIRLELLRLLVQYYNMVQWCLVESLLPETKEESTQVPGVFAYPFTELSRATRKRRTELKALKGVVTECPPLLIDGLLESAGPQINDIWGVDGDGLYPPPSMQALVQLFLLEDILFEVKQAILLYFLQDLAAVFGCEDNHQSVVSSFIRSFSLLPSLVHTVQGLWFIDHRDSEEGLRHLVNPNVQSYSWSAWVDVAVVNTLLAQGQNATAAHYIHSGHSLGATLEEQKLNIAVLVRNKKVSPAVDYMRQRCYHKQDPSDLMPFMMRECQESKMIGQLLQLHLLHAEEAEVEKYLRDSAEPHAMEPLLLYYLTHSRFIEAFTLNEEMNKMDKLEATSFAAKEKAANRNRLMGAYLRVLPDITRKLLMEKQRRPAIRQEKKLEVARPKPLSTVVYNKDQHVISRSHLIMNVMDKVEEAMKAVEEACEEEDDKTALEMEDRSNPVFIATPLTPRYKSFTSLAFTPVATSVPESQQSLQPTNPLSAAKKTLQNMTVAGQESEQSLWALTEECLDLLRTPLKGSHSEFSPKPSAINTIMKTPQSILKVRRLSRTLLSSAKDSRSTRKTPPETHKRPKKLGFSASDTAISSPSSSLSELKEDGHSPVMEASHVNKSMVTTPKHLRFVGLSPSPSPSPSPLPVKSKESLLREDSRISDVVSEESREISYSDATNESIDMQEINKEAGVTDVVEDEQNGPEVIEEKDECQQTETTEEQPSELHVVNEVLTGDQEIECMETNSPRIETIKDEVKDHVSFHEGPVDRYVEELDNLVRPDLQSPWKNNQSSEEIIAEHSILKNSQSSDDVVVENSLKVTQSSVEVVDEERLWKNHQSSDDSIVEKSLRVAQSSVEVVDEERLWKNSQSSDDMIVEKKDELNLTHMEEEPITPAMTSSPVEEPVKAVKEISDHTATESQPVVSSKELEEGDTHVEEMVGEKIVIAELHRKMLSALIGPRKSLANTMFTSSLEMIKEKSNTSSRTSISQNDTLKVETSLFALPADPSPKSKGESSPENKTSRDLESPPASPPLSKRVKMMTEEKEFKGRRRMFDFTTPQKPIEEEVGSIRTSERKSPKSKGESSPENKTSRDLKSPATPPLSRRVTMMAEEKEVKGRRRKFDFTTPQKPIERELRSTRASDMKSTASFVNKRDEDETKKNYQGSEESEQEEVRQSSRQKTPERKSPSRSVKRKAPDDKHDHDETSQSDKGSEQKEVRRSMRQKTPERKSPSRSVKRKAPDDKHDHDDETKKSVESSEESEHEEVRQSKRQKTPERKSPSRSVKTKILDDKHDDDEAKKSDKGSEESEQEEVRRSRRQKTPERKSPSRSVKTKAPDNESEHDEEKIDESMTTRSRLHKTPERSSPARYRKEKNVDEESDKMMNAGETKSKRQKTPERSPARSSKRKGNNDSSDNDVVETRRLRQSKTPERRSPARIVMMKAENEYEKEKDAVKEHEEQLLVQSGTNMILEEVSAGESNVQEESRKVVLRQRKTPERKSPSRSVQRKKTESMTDDEIDAVEVIKDSRMSLRLRSSPGRDLRGKTPEKTVKSTSPQKYVKEEDGNLERLHPELIKEVAESEEVEDVHFVPAEEVIEKLTEESLTSSPARRSTRLDTPERTINSTQQIEPPRRLSRGRSTSSSMSMGDNQSGTLNSVHGSASRRKRASSPSRTMSTSPVAATENTLELRRSRRASRTPERFRTDKAKSPTEIGKSKAKSEGETISPTRKSDRKAKSPQRLNTKEIESVKQSSSPRRDLALALKASTENVVKDFEEKSGEVEEQVWAEELPPLRLDGDREGNAQNKEKGQSTNSPVEDETECESQEEKPRAMFLDFSHAVQSQSVSQLSKSSAEQTSLSQPHMPFVFSEPLMSADQTVDASDKQDTGSNDMYHGFVFSQPTVAQDETVDDDKTEVERRQSIKKKKAVASSKKQKKRLLDSPDLLPISTPEHQALVKKERRRTRMSEIQRATARVMSQYSHRLSTTGPRKLRLVPSSQSSEPDEVEK